MKDTRIPGLFFEIVLEHCLLICNRLPRTLYARPVTSATAIPAAGNQGGGGGNEVVNRRICDSDYVIEAGESLSLAADPAAMIVLFDDLVSRPIDIIYKAQGVSVMMKEGETTLYREGKSASSICLSLRYYLPV